MSRQNKIMSLWKTGPTGGKHVHVLDTQRSIQKSKDR